MSSIRPWPRGDNPVDDNTALGELLTSADAAAEIGVTELTYKNYVSTGRMPQPDGYVGRTPVWHKLSVARAQLNRSLKQRDATKGQLAHEGWEEQAAYVERHPELMELTPKEQAEMNEWLASQQDKE